MHSSFHFHYFKQCCIDLCVCILTHLHWCFCWINLIYTWICWTLCIYKILVIMPNWTVKSLPIYIPTNSIYKGPLDFPGGSDGKKSACSTGDLGSVTGLRRLPWRRKWQPTPVFLPGESMDWGAWWATKAFDCVDHNKLWKILKETEIPDHLNFLLKNLYAGQEATVRTGHGTTDWFQIRKGVSTSRLYIVTLLI